MSMSDDVGVRMVALAKQIEALDEQRRELRENLESVMREVGIDQMVQDPETLAVYKVYVPSGTFVSFRTIDYKRTALEGERGGTVLAKKEAEEAGFKLKK